MFLSNASIRRPVAMTTVILVLLLFGLLSYRKLGLDLMPQIEFPFVTIVTPYPGATPDEIETSIAKPVEDAVVAIEGIRHLHSTCMEGVCQTLIEFELDRDVDTAAMDVREKIDLIRSDLPEAAEDPRILKFDINARPIATLALMGTVEPDLLYDYADNQLKDRLSTLAGVASVEIAGGAPREVRIDVQRERLATRGLTVLDVVQALRDGHAEVPAGALKDGSREFTVTFDGEAASVEAFGDLPLRSPPGRRVLLRDVADVRMAMEDPDTTASLNGRPCVSIKVIKKGDANAVRVVERVRAAFRDLQKGLPGGMELAWFRDDGDYVRSSVDDAWGSVWMGVMLTALILVLFLQDLRTAFIAFVSMPASIIVSFAGMQALGYTLNMPTLLAFGISVDILVTNSIVVLENVVGRIAHHEDTAESVRRGTSEVATAVFASALTNIVVFYPIARMQAMTGRFLGPFAMVITIATVVSLFVSFTLTPILSVFFLRRESRLNAGLARLLGPWQRAYAAIERAYDASLRRLAPVAGWSVLAMLALLVLGMRWAVPRVGVDFVTRSDRGELTVKLEYPGDFNLAETTRRAEAAAARLRADPLVRGALVVAGKVQGIIGQVSEGPYLAEISLTFAPKTERPENLDQLRDRVRALLAGESGCLVSVMVPSDIGGASKFLEAEISGDDLATLNRIGAEAFARMKAMPGVADPESSVREGKPELRVVPRRPVLRDLGVAPAQLGLALRGNVEGLKAGAYQVGDRSYDIRVKLAEQPGLEQVAAFDMPGPDSPMHLGALGDLEPGTAPARIVRAEKRRIVKLMADPAAGTALGTVAGDVRGAIAPHLPAGYGLRFVGMIERMDESNEEFKTVMLVAILLTYLLLAAMLESWTQPFLILTTVPFAYMGLFGALALTRMNLSIMGLLSGVMLIGVVVNNAILVMDGVNALRAGGAHRLDAILKASVMKFRPILMTSVAAILGMLPMATGRGLGSEIRASCGVGAVGGMIVSSVLSLYFVPLLYMKMGRRDERPHPLRRLLGWLRRRRGAAEG